LNLSLANRQLDPSSLDPDLVVKEDTESSPQVAHDVGSADKRQFVRINID